GEASSLAPASSAPIHCWAVPSLLRILARGWSRLRFSVPRVHRALPPSITLTSPNDDTPAADCNQIAAWILEGELIGPQGVRHIATLRYDRLGRLPADRETSLLESVRHVPPDRVFPSDRGLPRRIDHSVIGPERDGTFQILRGGGHK